MDPPELISGSHTRFFIDNIIACIIFTQKAAYPHLEKFLEVGYKNCNETQAFKKRH